MAGSDATDFSTCAELWGLCETEQTGKGTADDVRLTQVSLAGFELNRLNYLLVVDYFSRYPEVIQLTSTTSASVISALKSVFARHGIPEIVRSDNGPQYSSSEFGSFASSYGFQHLTSSPRFPQSNGQAERSVQTVKNLLKKSDDPYTSLLSYRATPLSWYELSPAELSMGRRLRTSVPQTDKMLIPQWPYLKSFRELDKQQKQKQKENFDLRHRAKELQPIPNDTEVWITTESSFTRKSTTIVCSRDTIWTYRTQSQPVDCRTERELGRL